MRAVFLIKSPLQLLNATEAREYFGYRGDECLLVLIADRKSKPQLEALVRTDERWGNAFVLSELPLRPDLKTNKQGRVVVSRGSQLFRNDLYAIMKLRNLASTLDNLEQVFIGDMGNPLMRHFANCLPLTEIVTLDDGTATLYYSLVRNGCKQMAKKPGVSKRTKLFFKRSLLGLQDQELEKITFFSVYKLEAKSPDQYVRHSYPWLRQKIEDVELVDKTFFLGSPLVEAGILGEEESFRQLQGVAKLLDGQDVVYVAHRRENPERVRKVGEMFGWETCLFDYPIEYQLARVGPRPRQLSSFISSALENCQNIFGDSLSIISYRLDPEWYSLKETTKGKSIYALYGHYKTLENKSFKVVPLNLE